jgi:DNA modification methylase
MAVQNHMTIEEIKKLGKEKSTSNTLKLIELFKQEFPVEIKREIASSIGRQKDDNLVYDFLVNNVFSKNYMDVVYQFYRTTLYKSYDERFNKLSVKIEKFYDNEIIYKMRSFYDFKKSKKLNLRKSSITKPLLLRGDSKITLRNINDGDINMIFTSPPYYNAREYSDYTSYKKYLDEMKKVFIECQRVLEDGRFMLVNISPVITKRPGREFESIRYPIHFDYHKILEEAGFYFIDELIWIKPEASVPNRIGGYMQTMTPLGYKPNCITESVLVYRKNSDFLLDKNIEKYIKNGATKNNDNEIDKTNCWFISPKSSKKHPAIFPEELCEKVLKYYSYENDVILDPFAGSGTLGKVASKMNRIPVMCEQNVEYINHMKKELDYDDL